MIKTRYFTIHYHDEDQLKEFKKNFLEKIFVPKNNDILKVELDDVVRTIRRMFGYSYKELTFNIYLYDTDDEIAEKCFDVYGKRNNYFAFCDRSGNMYCNCNRITSRIIKHETGHLMFEAYEEKPPALHEIIAKSVE